MWHSDCWGSFHPGQYRFRRWVRFSPSSSKSSWPSSMPSTSESFIFGSMGPLAPTAPRVLLSTKPKLRANSEYATSQPSGSLSPSVSSSTGFVFQRLGASREFIRVSLSMSNRESGREPHDGSRAQRPVAGTVNPDRFISCRKYLGSISPSPSLSPEVENPPR